MSDQVAFLNYLASILCRSLPGQRTALLPQDATEAPASRNAAHGDEGCPLRCVHHEPARARWDGRSPSPSPSWLTATGTVPDYFPIALSTHRNAELDADGGSFPLRSHARPCNLQRKLRSPSQRSQPGARSGRAQRGRWAGEQPELRSHRSDQQQNERLQRALQTPEGKGKATAKSC